MKKYTRLFLVFLPLIFLNGCLGVDVSERLTQSASQPDNGARFQWESGPLGVNAAVNQRPFPDSNPWNTDISTASVDPNSDTLLTNCGVGALHAAFGAPSNGTPNGFSYTVVDSSQAEASVDFNEASLSDSGPYPIPSGAPIGDGLPNSEGQVLVVVRDAGRLYEMSYAVANGGDWLANAGAIFDLVSGTARPDGFASAQASGMPIFPGLVRTDEVIDQGVIAHALSFSCPNNADAHIGPATANPPPALGTSGNLLLAMGSRVRLRASFDISPYSPAVQVILTALKKYGMYLSDRGPAYWMSGTSDSRWPTLSDLSFVRNSDLEVVQ